MNNHTFSYLFNKYRLRSQFETLSEFGEALAKEGFLYEDSIFSRWKNGNRLPTKRRVLIAIIKVFISHKGITKVEEANELLTTTNHIPLTKEEQSVLFNNSYFYLNTKDRTLLNEETALFLAQQILGSPFLLLNTYKIKSLYKETTHQPLKFIAALREIQERPEKIDIIINLVKTNGLLIHDAYSNIMQSLSKKMQKMSSFLTKNPPHFCEGLLVQ